jgi:hypothetical protein
LTDRFVYKVKKPVNFGFLDFTSLAARKQFCEEEVRLNRRLAPGVYMGVVEIKVCDGHIRLEGPGETVEYAVQMHRLPEERMLPAQLATGQVTPETMQRLARLAGVRPAEGGRAHGSVVILFLLLQALNYAMRREVAAHCRPWWCMVAQAQRR